MDARPVTPLGILVEHLQTAVQMVESEPGVSVGKTHLQKLLAAGIDPYIGECTSKESAALAAIAQKTCSEQWGKRRRWFYCASFGAGDAVRTRRRTGT